eukprot:4855724-Amphidinium_carterae.1
MTPLAMVKEALRFLVVLLGFRSPVAWNVRMDVISASLMGEGRLSSKEQVFWKDPGNAVDGNRLVGFQLLAPDFPFQVRRWFSFCRHGRITFFVRRLNITDLGTLGQPLICGGNRLFVQDREAGLEDWIVCCAFEGDLFDRNAVQEWLEHFCEKVVNIVANPRQN